MLCARVFPELILSIQHNSRERLLNSNTIYLYLSIMIKVDVSLSFLFYSLAVHPPLNIIPNQSLKRLYIHDNLCELTQSDSKRSASSNREFLKNVLDIYYKSITAPCAFKQICSHCKLQITVISFNGWKTGASDNQRNLPFTE